MLLAKDINHFQYYEMAIGSQLNNVDQVTWHTFDDLNTGLVDTDSIIVNELLDLAFGTK